MSNVVRFPVQAHALSARRRGPVQDYEFSEWELNQLCRWYSAMRYAFPKLQGVMAVCHNEKVSAIGLYGESGATPNCLLSKHAAAGRIYLLWATDHDPPRMINSITEVTDAQIVAIAPPRDEKSWLDAAGWMKVFAGRTIAGTIPEAGTQPSPA